MHVEQQVHVVVRIARRNEAPWPAPCAVDDSLCATRLHLDIRIVDSGAKSNIKTYHNCTCNSVTIANNGSLHDDCELGWCGAHLLLRVALVDIWAGCTCTCVVHLAHRDRPAVGARSTVAVEASSWGRRLATRTTDGTIAKRALNSYAYLCMYACRLISACLAPLPVQRCQPVHVHHLDDACVAYHLLVVLMCVSTAQKHAILGDPSSAQTVVSVGASKCVHAPAPASSIYNCVSTGRSG